MRSPGSTPPPIIAVRSFNDGDTGRPGAIAPMVRPDRARAVLRASGGLDPALPRNRWWLGAAEVTAMNGS